MGPLWPLALLGSLLAQPDATDVRRRAVLVVAAPGVLDEGVVQTAKHSLQGRYRLREEPELTAALESLKHEPAPEETVRVALAKAKERLRRFDLERAKAALDEGQRAAEGLTPSAGGVSCWTALEIARAEIALVEGNRAAAMAAMSIALSIDPALQIDPSMHAPPIVELLESARAMRQGAARRSVSVDAQPPATQVFVEGKLRGTVPAVIELPSAPSALWMVADGALPRVVISSPEAGDRVNTTLEPRPLALEVAPIVDAIRATTGEARRNACLALAEMLKVDAVALLKAPDSAPEIIEPARSEPIAAPPIAALEERSPPRPLAWIGLAGTVAAVGASAALFFDASHRNRDLESRLSMKDASGLIDDPARETALSQRSAIIREQVASGIALGIGVAAAVVMTLAFLDDSR
jgi:hypothetical protein